MHQSRRHFIQLGLAGTAIFALGSVGALVGVGLQSTRLATPKRPLQALSSQGYSVIVAAAEALLDLGDPGVPSVDEIDVGGQIDTYLASVHPAVVAELETALFLLENAGIAALLEGRTQPFTALSVEERATVLASWAVARMGLYRKIFRGLQLLVCGVYWADPRTHLAVGYPGPPAISLPSLEPAP